ncbi:MAG TPA: DUF2961 domain-containing protein [Kiritimatiellia bacterium]|nr:DUF2961 domain-containing protein [Kiritimatiellia bacterium]
MRTAGSILFLLAIASTAFMGCGRPGTSGEVRPWTAFVEDLVDLAALPVLNDAAIRMVSSSDPQPGGNNDFNNFQSRSQEPGWVVLLDEQGPGVIRRFWMTGTDPGHPVRIFIDGERTPRIEGVLEDLFGHMDPWLVPLAQYVNMCFYSYVPIPFNRSIRIETREPNTHPFWGPRRIFYQLSVESLPGQRVESYPRQLTPEQLAVAAKVRDAWTHAIESRDIPFTTAAEQHLVEPGTTQTLFAHEGSGTLTAVHLNLTPAEPAAWSRIDAEFLLQDAILNVYYGRQALPSISVPVGHLFANAWRKRELGNLWMTSGPDGYTLRLPLPFTSGIRMDLVNGADRPIEVRFEAELTDHVAGGAGYLHAEWRRSGPTGAQHHPITQIEGRGKFLGCFLGVSGLDQSWWILEGDERMWVDGATAPTWDGTGLEDYFNGGWYYRGAVFGALNASFDRAPFRVAQYRLQHPDPVSFRRNFRMEFERMRMPQTGQPVQGYFESIAYFYLETPTPVRSLPQDRTARRATEDPLHRQTFMLQLLELERANDFRGAMHAVEEYFERFPGAEEEGIYRLRHLEYRRLLGEPVTAAHYQPFLDGTHGPGAKEQATLLDWFYAAPNRAIVGMNVNGRGRLFLNGRGILTGDHPYNLFVAGTELSPGPQQIAAQVEFQRDEPWFQAGIRSHTGVAGTGPGSLSTQQPESGWRTGPVASPPWHTIGIRDIPRGAPDAPYIGGIPNAFILVQSKAFPIRALDWGYHRGQAYYRQDFTAPLEGWPAFSIEMTGLRQ